MHAAHKTAMYVLWLQVVGGTEEEVIVGPCTRIEAVREAKKLMFSSGRITSYSLEEVGVDQVYSKQVNS